MFCAEMVGFTENIGSRDDMIFRPLEFVRMEFERNSSVTPQMIDKLYQERCFNHDDLSKIQSLNKHSLSELTDGKVVHFRCMVQDMYDSEFFFKVYNLNNKDGTHTTLRCGLYQDIIKQDENEEFTFESPHNMYGDRQVIYCVPIPGESAWAKEAHNSKFSKKMENISHSNSVVKRKIEDEAETLEPATSMETDSSTDPSPKRIKSDNCQNQSTKSCLYKQNFPLENETGYPVIVKVYNRDVKVDLNDTIEVFGILSLDSHVSDIDSEEMECGEAELRARNPHPSMVPRLHALVVRKVESDHPFYSLPNFSALGGSLSRCREQLLTIFQHCFDGDELVSEYLLCHLVSGVHARVNMSALGKFSLNITKVSSKADSIPEFYRILCQLVSKCHLFPMTIGGLNRLDLTPSKDYEENRLVPGMLQLSSRTHLVVDEVSLQPGKLEEKGVLNMAALSNLVERQEVTYNFKYHTQNFPTNIRVLVLSEGKSLLNCDYVVPLVASHNSNKSPEDVKVFLAPSTLDPIRAFLCSSEVIVPSLPEEVQQEIEKDFVENRKAADNKMVPEDLHATLTLARYVALSHGSSAIELAHWKRAMEMERLRKERIK